MAQASPQKILLIDADPQLHGLLEDYCARFRSGPWGLHWTDDPAKGLTLLQSGRFGVCLLDFGLCGAKGQELLYAAGGHDCSTPVVLLLADATEDTIEAALEAGPMDYLVREDITLRMLEHTIRYARKLGDTMSRLRLLATHDALTGLYNRREFDRIITEEWQRSTRFDHPFTLVMADIDHFKQVNDTHGHQVGDAVLHHVASLLGGQTRLVDRVCRYGGEEFAIIMVETGLKQAVDVVERLFALLAETPCFIADRDLILPVTLSAGVVTSPDDADNVVQLIAAADQALYEAKHTGRNRVVAGKGRQRQQPPS